MKKLALLTTLCMLSVPSLQGVQAQPVITDSRIKTLVYNENDVYSLLTHHGYQSHIEFGPKETIRTISVGDKISWQVIPDGRRLFVRSHIAGAHTNMTVITNERSYLFDLRATKGGVLPVREDLVYAVRFYYPDEHVKTALPDMPPVYADDIIGKQEPDYVRSAQLPPTTLPPLNFNYTYVGDDMLAPTKMFDDGKATYLMLPKIGDIYSYNMAGQELAVRTSLTSDGFVKVPLIGSQFTVRYPEGDVTVYNETMGGQ